MVIVSKAKASKGHTAHRLTARERQVVCLVLAGYSNKDLARKLGVKERTAKNHLSRIFNKVGAANRVELVLIAIHRGLIDEHINPTSSVQPH